MIKDRQILEVGREYKIFQRSNGRIYILKNRQKIQDLRSKDFFTVLLINELVLLYEKIEKIKKECDFKRVIKYKNILIEKPEIKVDK